MFSGIFIFATVLKAEPYKFAVLNFQGRDVAKRKWFELTEHLSKRVGKKIF